MRENLSCADWKYQNPSEISKKSTKTFFSQGQKNSLVINSWYWLTYPYMQQTDGLILQRLRLFIFYSFRKFSVGSEMKRKDFGLRQHCLHTELALMLSFSFVYLISYYSQQRRYSIHRIPAWTQVPTATGDALGLLTTSGRWPGSVETPKVLCDICHALQISWHIKWHMLPFNSPSPVSAGSGPRSCSGTHDRDNIQVSICSWVLPFSSDLDYPLVILPSFCINICSIFSFSVVFSLINILINYGFHITFTYYLFMT